MFLTHKFLYYIIHSPSILLLSIPGYIAYNTQNYIIIHIVYLMKNDDKWVFDRILKFYCISYTKNISR